jgi:hypothetical protein
MQTVEGCGDESAYQSVAYSKEAEDHDGRKGASDAGAERYKSRDTTNKDVGHQTEAGYVLLFGHSHTKRPHRASRKQQAP